MEKLTLNRERIGPVNLVASDELTRLEEEHGSSASEQAELTEAVKRLRGSIGNLNREGRERLRNAFEEVDRHFRRLFTRLLKAVKLIWLLLTVMIHLMRVLRSMPSLQEEITESKSSIGRGTGSHSNRFDFCVVFDQPRPNLRS